MFLKLTTKYNFGVLHSHYVSAYADDAIIYIIVQKDQLKFEVEKHNEVSTNSSLSTLYCSQASV